MDSPRPVLGILGAGKLGIAIAQLALKVSYAVFIAGSSTAEKIKLSIEILTPGAIAVTAEDAIRRSDIVILALPLSKYRNLPVDLLKGKLVIDAMNYWWEVDGSISELESASSSSEMVQHFLPQSRVVKAFSHIGYHHLLDDARPLGVTDRKAMAIAGNNVTDVQIVACIVSDLGFDPVLIGNLADGKILEPGTPLFGASINEVTMRKLAGLDNK
ncbi:MAG TPA: NAD(P)-binding domain-containing protein [Patescibacteria group bacterium]|nr:NAD(P)-binding domain-containing protein [Patescibacteria group bacterium]